MTEIYNKNKIPNCVDLEKLPIGLNESEQLCDSCYYNAAIIECPVFCLLKNKPEVREILHDELISFFVGMDMPDDWWKRSWCDGHEECPDYCEECESPKSHWQDWGKRQYKKENDYATK